MFFFFFFFQAEDGIRDKLVTGVQTCALPIFLMTIAAPLLLLASPGAAFLRGLPVPARRAAIWALRSDRVRRIGRALTHPAVCWLVGTGVVIAWHVPAAHELGLRSSSWHLVQHATFFASGLLFWWPVVHGTPRTALGAAPLYLFLATLRSEERRVGKE